MNILGVIFLNQHFIIIISIILIMIIIIIIIIRCGKQKTIAVLVPVTDLYISIYIFL